MIIYKLQNGMFGQPSAVTIVGQNISIPFAADNTDFAQFKLDIANGAELRDAEDNVMTQEQADEFLATLP